MTLKLNAPGGGSVTIDVPTTASDFTLTAPASTGNVVVSPQPVTVPNATGTVMVSGNMPAFSAYKGGSGQSITSGVFTKVTYDVEEFDTASCFASSRFTPTVAGYYQINANTYLQATTGLTRVLTTLYKNGAGYKFGNDNLAVSTTEGRGLVSSLVYLNGTTDYVEIYVLVNATTPVIQTSVDNTWFNGSLVRAA